ncbi:MAG TPA: hypothetical protein PKI19_11890 [Elusimicrobiales bacterium]|nr:hypothetical protein [Elusimicrobiales bacterium]
MGMNPRDVNLFFQVAGIARLQGAAMLLSPVAAAVVARHKNRSEVLWGISTFFCPLIGSLIIFSIRSGPPGAWFIICEELFRLFAGPLFVVFLALLPAGPAAGGRTKLGFAAAVISLLLVMLAFFFFALSNFPVQH